MNMNRIAARIEISGRESFAEKAEQTSGGDTIENGVCGRISLSEQTKESRYFTLRSFDQE